MDLICKNPEYAYLYALNVSKERLSVDLEKVFTKSPKYAYFYARDVIGGCFDDFVNNYLVITPFEENEDRFYAKKYMKKFLKQMVCS